MFIVVSHIFSINAYNPCVVTETRKKAQEWIDNELKGKFYNGLGQYEIQEIDLYN